MVAGVQTGVAPGVSIFPIPLWGKCPGEAGFVFLVSPLWGKCPGRAKGGYKIGILYLTTPLPRFVVLPPQGGQ